MGIGREQGMRFLNRQLAVIVLCQVLEILHKLAYSELLTFAEADQEPLSVSLHR